MARITTQHCINLLPISDTKAHEMALFCRHQPACITSGTKERTPVSTGCATFEHWFGRGECVSTPFSQISVTGCNSILSLSSAYDLSEEERAYIQEILQKLEVRNLLGCSVISPPSPELNECPRLSGERGYWEIWDRGITDDSRNGSK